MSIPVQKLSEKVFNEPLTQETFAIRKNLLLVSCVTVLLTVYNVQIHELPWVKLKIANDEDSSNLLLGALSVAITYFLVRFSISALSDFKRWRHADKLMQLNDYDAMIKIAMDHHLVIDAYTSGLRNGRPLDNPEQLKESSQKAIEWFGDAKKEARNIKISHITLSYLQWSKLLVVDLGVPLIMGTLSFSLTKSAFIPFVLVLFQA